MAIKFGKKGEEHKTLTKALNIARSILSGIFMTLAILLVLLSVSELFVMFLDRSILDNTHYLDWTRGPFIIFLSSIPFFIFYILLNLDRFRWSKGVLKKFRTSKPPKKIETIDLD